MTSRKAAVVAVIGSAMTDLTCYADELPVGGQTLVGHLFTSGFGGKGANQVLVYVRSYSTNVVNFSPPASFL